MRLSSVLGPYSEQFNTKEGLEGLSPRQVACLAGSFALGSHNREAFFNLWVPCVLDNLTFDDPLFKETLLLLLSSYMMYGARKGPYFSKLVDKISLVSINYKGRDLAHLRGLVGLLSLRIPSVREVLSS